MKSMSQTTGAGRTRKGGETKERIVDCALRKFRQYGYDGTTMRGIAEDAGVSLGNAYYYFKSKDHLITAYYRESHETHIEACEPILDGEKNLKKRLLGVLRTRVETSMPYHRFSMQLFKTAADPESPLSPFSDEQTEVRDLSVDIFRRVIDGSSTKVSGKLATELPMLLWTYQMGIILYWVHDRSQGCSQTYKLIDHSTDLVVRLIQLNRLPPMRPLVNRTLKLLADLKPLRTNGA